jgi:hypothetical protein
MTEVGFKSYQGEWIEGMFHGTGLYNFDNGDSYDGEFARGKKNGSGVY